MTDLTTFKGKWDYYPDCVCAKCENFWNMLADCVGDARSMEEGGATPDRPVKGWRLHHRPWDRRAAGPTSTSSTDNQQGERNIQ